VYCVFCAAVAAAKFGSRLFASVSFTGCVILLQVFGLWSLMVGYFHVSGA
jgi:hypothetical protein